jgi:hypothetical protein
VRGPKEITWLNFEEESDEEAAKRDPREESNCDCKIVHEYWNGCSNKARDGRSMRGVCECYRDRGNHTEACNAEYDALPALVHNNRTDWLAAKMSPPLPVSGSPPPPVSAMTDDVRTSTHANA